MPADLATSVTPRDIRRLYRLPETVQYCARCVISNQRPRIVFDAEGVCNACRYARRKHGEIDWAARERELRALCDRFRSRQGRYDVIVPASGGKDSTYVAYTLKTEYGMHPLTVTWSPLRYTEVGWENLRRFIRSGYDNILGTANDRTARVLARYALEELGEPFQPFIYGQMAFPLRMAALHKIPLVFYGENGEAEYGGDAYNENARQYNLETELDRHCFSGLRPEFFKQHGLTDADLLPFQPPGAEELRSTGIEAHFMSYYRPWVPQQNYYIASEHAGFTPNPDGRSEGTYSKYASLDDRFDGFHYYLMFCKFGIGRATSDAAHEIRDGHLTRDEGVRLVRKYDGEFPRKYFQEFLDYCRITDAQFWAIVDGWRAPHLWERADGTWKLKYQVS